MVRHAAHLETTTLLCTGRRAYSLAGSDDTYVYTDDPQEITCPACVAAKEQPTPPRPIWRAISKQFDGELIELILDVPAHGAVFNMTPDQARDLGTRLLEWSARMRDQTLHVELDEVRRETMKLNENMAMNIALYDRNKKATGG